MTNAGQFYCNSGIASLLYEYEFHNVDNTFYDYCSYYNFFTGRASPLGAAFASRTGCDAVNSFMPEVRV